MSVAVAFTTCVGCQWYGACTKDKLCWEQERERLASESRLQASDRRELRRSTLTSETNGSHVSGDVDGLELLERMDADEPLEPSALEEPAGLSASPEVEREPSREAGSRAGSSSAETTGPAQPASTPKRERHRRSSAGGGTRTTRRSPVKDQWTREAIIDALRAHAAEHGYPPTSTEWSRNGDGHPNAILVKRVFGSWADAVVEAGFPRPQRGRKPSLLAQSSGREPAAEQAIAEGASGTARVDVAAAAKAKRPSRPDTTGWIKVRGTGLHYRTSTEAYLAAEEVEADGERVAKAARDDGDEGKADQAVDASRALAEKIREAARKHEPPAEAAPPPALERLLITPAAMDGVQRAYAVAAIAAARTFADTLERELAE